MTFTPCDFALASIAAPEPESRLTSRMHLRAVGDGLLGLLLLGRLVALGVLDLDRHAGGLERLLQERPVGRLPAHRRLRVGQQHGDLVGLRCRSLLLLPLAAAVVVAATGGDDERERAQAAGDRQRSVASSVSASPAPPPPLMDMCGTGTRQGVVGLVARERQRAEHLGALAEDPRR